MTTRFGDCELDLRRRELRRDGVAVAVQPKVLDMIAYLVAHRDRVVPKNELLDALWPGEAVTEASLTFCISAARKAVGDAGSDQRIIKSWRGRGYRFVAETSDSAPRSAATTQPRPAPTRPASELPTLVGRPTERQLLATSVERAKAGRGGLLLLRGEAGIGKTRMLQEAAALARANDCAVLSGTCLDPGGSLPFWPWVEVLKGYSQSVDAGTLADVLGPCASDLAELVPTLRAKLRALNASVSLQPEQARLRLFESFATFLANAASRQPLVVCLDDLHWADRDSLVLLRHLTSDLALLPLLLIGTYRDTDVARDHPMAAVVADLRRQDRAEVIALAGLGISEVAQLLGQSAGATVSTAMVTAITERSAGNPFFIEQLGRHIARSAATSTSAAKTDASLPESIRDAVHQRLSLLPDECRRLLPVAAVVGNQFSFTTLSTALAGESDTDSVLESLDHLVSAQVLREVDGAPGDYRFTHALLRECLYAELTAVRRVVTHRRIAAALETMVARGIAVHPAELALHFSYAAVDGDSAKAVHYLGQAGDLARQGYAYEEEERLLQQAIALLEVDRAGDEPLRCTLQLRLAAAQYSAGNPGASRQTCLDAAATARKLGHVTNLARAAIRAVWARPRLATDPEPPTELLEEALAKLPESENSLRGQVLSRLALVQAQAPEPVDATELFAKARALVEAGDDAAALPQVLCDSLLGLAATAPPNVTMEPAVALERYAVEHHDLSLRLVALRSHAYALLECGDIPAYARMSEEHTAITSQARVLADQWNVALLGSTIAFFEGRLGEAERAADEAFRIGRRYDKEGLVSFGAYWTQLFEIRQAQGRLAELEPIVVGIGSGGFGMPFWAPALALLYCELDRPAEARAVFDPIVADRCRAFPPNHPMRDWQTWLGGICLLSEVCAALGDATAAEAVYERLLPYDGRWAVVNWGVATVGPVARFLGLLAATFEDWDRAITHLEAELAHQSSSQTPIDLARVSYNLGDVLLRSRRDPARARTLLTSASEAAKTLGMSRLANRADALLARPTS